MTRETALPPIARADIEQHPEKLRRTPRGGWAWKCGLCGQYASSLTVKGELRCYQHGGTRKRQRDLAAHAEAREAGLKPPRPPGRPIEHGFYGAGEKVNVHELVDEYRARGAPPDDTDPDMLHLRARISNDLALEPKVEEAEVALGGLLEALASFPTLQVSGEGKAATVEDVLVALGELNAFVAKVREVSRLWDKMHRFANEIKNDHERIIKMAKARAETRKANAAARQLDAFSMLLSNLMVVLAEMLPPDLYRALQVRIQKDFSEVSKRVLEPGTVKKPN
jgi:hypothetical protein